jgi:hypothetical protein
MMSPRLKTLERRLARLAAFFGDRDADTEKAGRLHEARKAMAALTREVIARAGLDPNESRTLRDLEAVEPPAPLPPLLRRRPVDSREALIAQLYALGERMRGRPPPLATASPMELLAYYGFGEGAREAPA